MHSTPSDTEATRALMRLRRALAVAVLLGTLLSLTPNTSWAAPEESIVPESELTISTPSDGAFIGRNSVTVSGTGTAPGAAVTVRVAGGQTCDATVEEAAEDGALTWACSIRSIGNGAGQDITATEDAEGDVTSTRVTVHVLGPPTIAPVHLTTGIISGTALAGARVQVSLSGGAGSCTTTATSTRYWSCTPTAAGGGRVAAARYDVAAQQSHSAIGPAGSFSSPAVRTIEVDNVAPASPVILSPTGDYRLLRLPATFTGTGEDGGSVDVYINGVPVCSAPIVGGNWSCVGGSALSNAAHEVRAVQIDAAGNHSNPSAAIRVFFGPRPAEPRPPRPTPSPTPSPTETAEPSEPEPSRTPAASPVQPSEPSFPLPDDDSRDALSNWGTPTTFGDGLPTLEESIDRGNWGRAPLLALGAILLVAVPSRLLANQLRGRIRRAPPRAAMRNRDPVPLVEAHTTGVTPWLSAALPFAVTVAFMVVSNGVDAEVRYLRLAAAVAAALGVLNLVGVAIASRVGHLWKGIDSRVRFRPMLLAAAIATGLFSRIVGLVPPLVSGTLIGLRMPHDTPIRGRVMVNFLQVGSVLGLGLVGWLGHSLVGDVVGFWPSLLSEFFAALCLVGIGSTLVLLLPLGAMPGRVLWEWHRWIWFGVVMVAYTLAFGLLLGGDDAHWPLGVMLIIAGSIAAAFIAAWAALRFLVRAPD